ncbi:MAG: GNAT family N-acetyltransferase [Firmicutes bacterium]|nr:GNAT family N-acetyltransferase [Bacillota bacterium]
MIIRQATLKDLDQIWKLRLETTVLLFNRGIDQWQYEDPSLETFTKDISEGEFYVATDDNGFLLGMMAVRSNIEHTYDVIFDGKWSDEQPYLTIHRLAVKRDLLGSGTAKLLLEYADQIARLTHIDYIRIDTHEQNKYAIRLFESFDYIYCGWILLVQDKGDLKRLAFDKKIKRSTS